MTKDVTNEMKFWADVKFNEKTRMYDVKFMAGKEGSNIAAISEHQLSLTVTEYNLLEEYFINNHKE